MTVEQIIAIVIGVAPCLTAIIGIVAAAVKSIKTSKETSQTVVDKFEEVREEIFNTKEYSELKSQLLLAYQENRELKKKINELLTKIDRIDRSKEE